jgi:ligand-binding sensor domain-containing protein/two-component sensor histidine kinase
MLSRHQIIFRISYLRIFLFFFCAPSAYAQENISFKHFSTEEGLSAPVLHIVQDKYGFLWLGTSDGLNRFDGKYFTPYRNIAGNHGSLCNNIINCIYAGSSGKIWVATNDGLCYYNFSDDSFSQVSFNDSLEKIDRQRVYAVVETGDGNTWFATRTMLHVLYENGTETFPLPFSENLIVKYLHAGKGNKIWIGANNSHVFIFDIKKKKFTEASVASPFSDEKKLSLTIHPIIPFSADTLLIGTWYGGMQKIFPYRDTIRTIPLVDSAETDPRNNIVSGIAHVHESTWWAGTYGNGIATYDARSGKFKNHFHHNPSDAKSLSSDYINTIFTDSSGIVWIGTVHGLDKFDPLTQQFQSVPVPSSSNEFSVYRLPSSIVEDKKDSSHQWLWITVPGVGLFHFNRISSTFKLYSSQENKKIQALPDKNVHALFYDNKERLWIGMKSGVCLFDEAAEKFIVFKFPGDSNVTGIHKIFQDHKNRFWFVSFSNGIYCYDHVSKKITSYRYNETTKNSLPDNRIFTCMEDHTGKIWIGTQNRGLCRLDPETGMFTYFMNDKKDPGSLPNNGVYDLFEDKHQHLWIATENGLAEMNLTDFKMKIYTTADGLCNNDVFSITTDLQDHIWLATNSGVSDFDPERKSFKNYSTNDGLPVNMMDGAVCCTRDGMLYFGSRGMLSFCNPQKMKVNKLAPNVVITSFKIFDKPVPVMRTKEMLQPIHLSYKQSMLSFEFAALNFTNPGYNQYAYKLEGFDKDWIYCGNKQNATYTNLDGGTYTFRVKAANNDGIWNEKGTYALLTIDPPYWKTWWFYLLFTVVISAIIYSVYRIRINQLIQLQNIRVRISRDLHDDIGSTLSSINMMSSMANKTPATEKKTGELFQTISNASRQAMELMNDIVWSINPKNDRMDMMIIRMRQYASEILEAANISFVLETDDESKKISIPIEKRKDFYLIFKEAINNLSKYSRATEASIKISSMNSLLSLIIHDNGTGFNASENYPGNGLKNMKARAEQLEGKIEIISGDQKGTTIVLRIPLLP